MSWASLGLMKAIISTTYNEAHRACVAGDAALLERTLSRLGPIVSEGSIQHFLGAIVSRKSDLTSSNQSTRLLNILFDAYPLLGLDEEGILLNALKDTYIFDRLYEHSPAVLNYIVPSSGRNLLWHACSMIGASFTVVRLVEYGIDIVEYGEPSLFKQAIRTQKNWSTLEYLWRNGVRFGSEEIEDMFAYMHKACLAFLTLHAKDFTQSERECVFKLAHESGDEQLVAIGVSSLHEQERLASLEAGNMRRFKESLPSTLGHMWVRDLLKRAVSIKSTPAVDIILDTFPTVDFATWTLLSRATSGEVDMGIYQRLYQSMPSIINFVFQSGRGSYESTLQLACTKKDLQFAYFLLDSGVDLCTADRHHPRFTALDCAIRHKQPKELIERLLKAGYSNSPTKILQALRLSILTGQHDSRNLLLETCTKYRYTITEEVFAAVERLEVSEQATTLALLERKNGYVKKKLAKREAEKARAEKEWHLSRQTRISPLLQGLLPEKPEQWSQLAPDRSLPVGEARRRWWEFWL